MNVIIIHGLCAAPRSKGFGKNLDMENFLATAIVFNVLSEPIRLRIIDILSCGEICACDILKNLSITQSTLSHHMKVLISCGLVNVRKQATWMHYSINPDAVAKIHQDIDALTKPKDRCICESLLGNHSLSDKFLAVKCE